MFAAWRSCAAKVTTSRVRALEEGQRLLNALAAPFLPLAFPARSAVFTAAARHCRPSIAATVRARHRENALPHPPVASPWSPLPSPPHRRFIRASVRANRRFPSTAAMAVLTGDDAPRGQLSSRHCYPPLCLELGPVNPTKARRATR